MNAGLLFLAFLAQHSRILYFMPLKQSHQQMIKVEISFGGDPGELSYVSLTVQLFIPFGRHLIAQSFLSVGLQLRIKSY